MMKNRSQYISTKMETIIVDNCCKNFFYLYEDISCRSDHRGPSQMKNLYAACFPSAAPRIFVLSYIFFYLDELTFSMRKHLFLEDILPVINATITYNKDFMTSCEIFTLVGSRGKFGFLKKVALVSCEF